MSSISQITLPVPSLTESDIAMLQVAKKTGKLNLLFFNNGEKQAMVGMKTGSSLQFKVYESDNRSSWTLISGDWITVAPGGSEDASVMTQKRFVKITGRGVTAGGYAQLDIQARGSAFFGQVDIDLIGKSGYGKDGGGQAGVATYGADSWPE